MPLLVLSNGHGEDEVAVRIVRALRQQPHPPEVIALPIVGEGDAYRGQDIAILGPVQSMPSGGFIYMDRCQLWQDLHAGLLQLTVRQLGRIRDWARGGGQILAVGDVVPLSFAWWSGAPYAFVGTAKSEYYLRHEIDRPECPSSQRRHWLSGFKACVYSPWERWLMQHPRCRAVFPRDRLTATVLNQWPIPVFDLGNPMMDELDPKGQLQLDGLDIQPMLTALLLPGSHAPEAYANWRLILEAIGPLMNPETAYLFIAAIAPRLDGDPLHQALRDRHWQMQSSLLRAGSEVTGQVFAHGGSRLVLTHDGFSDGLHLAELAIAMAGTATEQCVGLGKPVITVPGQGPQFTAAFASAQARLLGSSVILVDHPNQVAAAVHSLKRFLNKSRQSLQSPSGPPSPSVPKGVILERTDIQSPPELGDLGFDVSSAERGQDGMVDPMHTVSQGPLQDRQKWIDNGDQRMGQPGAAKRIADCLFARALL